MLVCRGAILSRQSIRRIYERKARVLRPLRDHVAGQYCFGHLWPPVASLCMQCLQIDEPPARWIFSSEHLDMMAFLSDSSSSTCHLPNMSLLDLVELPSRNQTGAASVARPVSFAHAKHPRSMALSVLEESEEEQEQDERQAWSCHSCYGLPDLCCDGELQVPAYSWDPWNSRCDRCVDRRWEHMAPPVLGRLAGRAENGRLGTWFSESTWEHVD